MRRISRRIANRFGGQFDKAERANYDAKTTNVSNFENYRNKWLNNVKLDRNN